MGRRARPEGAGEGICADGKVLQWRAGELTHVSSVSGFSCPQSLHSRPAAVQQAFPMGNVVCSHAADFCVRSLPCGVTLEWHQPHRKGQGAGRPRQYRIEWAVDTVSRNAYEAARRAYVTQPADHGIDGGKSGSLCGFRASSGMLARAVGSCPVVSGVGSRHWCAQQAAGGSRTWPPLQIQGTHCGLAGRRAIQIHSGHGDERDGRRAKDRGGSDTHRGNHGGATWTRTFTVLILICRSWRVATFATSRRSSVGRVSIDSSISVGWGWTERWESSRASRIAPTRCCLAPTAPFVSTDLARLHAWSAHASGFPC